MSMPATAPAGSTASNPQMPAPRFHLSIRWKLVGSFAGAFTIFFVLIAWWMMSFTRTTTEDRLISELQSSAEGGAAGISAQGFLDLIQNVPAAPDPVTGKLGYPNDARYTAVSQELLNIRRVMKDGGVYSYFKSPKDGRIYFAASAGYLLTPQIGVKYMVPLDTVVDATVYKHMERGLTESVNEPPYSDAFGSWISTYTPIRDAQGNSVGALGIDYPLTYVDSVQGKLRSQLLPILGIGYLLLLAIVFALSTSLARPINRLTRATQRVAEGEYDLDVRALVPSRFPDELWTLADSFASMASKIAARERSLTQEVQRLKVEIDHVRREEAVREITETDFFSDLTEKAEHMRKRMRQGIDDE